MTDAYRVSLVTINSFQEEVAVSGQNAANTGYLSVKNGEAYVVTSDPRKIYDHFGPENVLFVERLGVGFYLGLKPGDKP